VLKCRWSKTVSIEGARENNLSTKRNIKRRTTRRKIATTKTLRRKISGSWQTTALQHRGRKARRAIGFLAGAGVVLFLLTIVMVLPWRWLAPPTSAFMLRERVVNDRAVDYRWVSWDRISPHLAIAVVASEDQKFPEHHGFDFESIAQALDEKRGPRRGASTITQQVAKNLFLWPGRSYIRKGMEAYFTILIETLWSKRRILEIYLNVAEFGPGIFGAGAASRHFFRKPAGSLSLWDASLLAAVLPNPKKMSPGRPSAYVRRRAWEIRTWVRKLGGERYLSGI
jgi:monofunctional biosynthetic peptidoglycan transglycosylase